MLEKPTSPERSTRATTASQNGEVFTNPTGVVSFERMTHRSQATKKVKCRDTTNMTDIAKRGLVEIFSLL